MDNGKRFRIGIIFNFTRGWLGGFYYYQNIINAIDFLDDQQKPEIIIFYNKEYSDYLNELHYPYLKLVPWQFIDIKKGYLLSYCKGKNVFVDHMIHEYKLDGIYAVNDNPVPTAKGIKTGTIAAAWFPDLQHKFFPEFFSRTTLFLRELRLRITLKNTNNLVVSSQDTADQFRKFYNLHDKLKIHVLRFVSVLDKYEEGEIEKLRSDYKIPKEYFIVSNSFLKHKNHIVVLNALKILKPTNAGMHIVFTGKVEVYKDPEHSNRLNSIIVDNRLEENVSFLGVIPRKDQLCIMRNARAVLQPSIFEGWNTTIEDAKSLQLPVIASDISVHKEQLGDRGTYFDPHNAESLARVLNGFEHKSSKPLYDDYETRVKVFAGNFLKIFKAVN